MRIHFPLFLKRFWFGNVQSRRGSHSFHPAHQFMKLKQRLHSVLVPSAEVLIKGRQNSPAIKWTSMLSIDDLFKGGHLD
jgi:hypothetical protein